MAKQSKSSVTIIKEAAHDISENVKNKIDELNLSKCKLEKID